MRPELIERYKELIQPLGNVALNAVANLQAGEGIPIVYREAERLLKDKFLQTETNELIAYLTATLVIREVLHMSENHPGYRAGKPTNPDKSETPET